MKYEANKTLDDYSNIVDDYVKLDKDYRNCKKNIDKLQYDNDKLKNVNEVKLSLTSKDEDYNILYEGCNSQKKENIEIKNKLNNYFNNFN